MRPVSVAGLGLLCPAGIGPEGADGGRPGRVPGFSARAYVKNRKNIKLMSRSVQLGIAGVVTSLSEVEGWQDVPAERRGMFVGATPGGGELGDLLPALDVATDDAGALDMRRFGEEGYSLIHPLWLVKGLSNNVLGFASAQLDFQGTNSNYCDGEPSGAIALWEGWAAVAERRADLVVAGASDSWVQLDAVLGGRKPGEGAAFFALRPAQPGDRWLIEPSDSAVPGLTPDEERYLGYLGCAGEPVRVARALLRGETAQLQLAGFPGLRIRPA